MSETEQASPAYRDPTTLRGLEEMTRRSDLHIPNLYKYIRVSLCTALSN